MKAEKAIRYRCLAKTCREEFDLAPRPVRASGPVGHRVTDGACPVCGSHARRLSWYGLMTQVKAEASVRDRLKAAGHRALFLHYLVPVKRSDRFSKSRRRKGTIEEVRIKRPVLPSGYIFARMTTGDIAPACGLPGVVGFVGTQEGAGRIPDGEMQDFLDWGDADGCVTLDETVDARRNPLRVGSTVRITEGPFAGFEGPVEQDDGRRFVSVRVTIFGHQRPIDLPYEAVEVIAEAA